MLHPTSLQAAKPAPETATTRKSIVSGLVVMALSTSVGCGAAGAEPPIGAAGTSSVEAGGSPSVGGSAAAYPITPVNPLGRARCRAPAGTTGSPSTIAQAVALLNALPKPTSVACFVEALDRPLGVWATSSAISAQPALSSVSPRVFIKLGLLWISVVIDGESSYLIEFGQLTNHTDHRSLKGELQLPLEAPIAPTLPFERIAYGSGTVCSLCHSNEAQHSTSGLSGVFASTALRPRPETHIGLDALREADRQCNWQDEPHRCEMLSALLQGGTVTEAPFPDSMETFY